MATAPQNATDRAFSRGVSLSAAATPLGRTLQQPRVFRGFPSSARELLRVGATSRSGAESATASAEEAVANAKGEKMAQVLRGSEGGKSFNVLVTGSSKASAVHHV